MGFGPRIISRDKCALELSGARVWGARLELANATTGRRSSQSNLPQLIRHSVIGRSRSEKLRTCQEIGRATRWSKCFRIVFDENHDYRFLSCKRRRPTTSRACLRSLRIELQLESSDCALWCLRATLRKTTSEPS